MSDKQNDEVLQRIRRIETRLWKLCEHVGLAAASPPGITVNTAHDITQVELKGFDVTIGAIRHALLDKGAMTDEPVNLIVNDTYVCNVQFMES